MPKKNPSKPVNSLPPGIHRQAEFERYAAYLSMALEERVAVFKVPKGTDQDFATKYKINRDTLVRWKGMPELWAIRDKHLVALRAYTGPIMRALARKAMQRGDAYEVETWMRLVEGYTPKQKSSVEVEGLADLIRQDMEGKPDGDGAAAGADDDGDDSA
jgi:hypothetical protein